MTRLYDVNVERVLCRLDELNEFLERFPDSLLVPAVREEIEHLENILRAVGF